MRGAEKVQAVDSVGNIRVDGVSSREKVGLQELAARWPSEELLGLPSSPPSLPCCGQQAQWASGQFCQLAVAVVAGRSATYIPVPLQVRRVVQICQQSLAKIVNGQRALLRLCPVRIVAKAVDADVSEAAFGR